jgi:hypothetical protein
MSRKHSFGATIVLTGGSVSTGVEAIGMVSQKMFATLEVERAAAIANAALSPAWTIAIYRPKIHANRRRLRAAKTPAMGIARRVIKSTPT